MKKGEPDKLVLAEAVLSVVVVVSIWCRLYVVYFVPFGRTLVYTLVVMDPRVAGRVGLTPRGKTQYKSS